MEMLLQTLLALLIIIIIIVMYNTAFIDRESMENVSSSGCGCGEHMMGKTNYRFPLTSS